MRQSSLQEPTIQRWKKSPTLIKAQVHRAAQRRIPVNTDFLSRGRTRDKESTSDSDSKSGGGDDENPEQKRLNRLTEMRKYLAQELADSEESRISVPSVVAVDSPADREKTIEELYLDHKKNLLKNYNILASSPNIYEHSEISSSSDILIPQFKTEPCGEEDVKPVEKEKTKMSLYDIISQRKRHFPLKEAKTEMSPPEWAGLIEHKMNRSRVKPKPRLSESASSKLVTSSHPKSIASDRLTQMSNDSVQEDVKRIRKQSLPLIVRQMKVERMVKACSHYGRKDIIKHLNKYIQWAFLYYCAANRLPFREVSKPEKATIEGRMRYNDNWTYIPVLSKYHRQPIIRISPIKARNFTMEDFAKPYPWPKRKLQKHRLTKKVRTSSKPAISKQLLELANKTKMSRIPFTYRRLAKRLAEKLKKEEEIIEMINDQKRRKRKSNKHVLETRLRIKQKIVPKERTARTYINLCGKSVIPKPIQTRRFSLTTILNPDLRQFRKEVNQHLKTLTSTKVKRKRRPPDQHLDKLIPKSRTKELTLFDYYNESGSEDEFETSVTPEVTTMRLVCNKLLWLMKKTYPELPLTCEDPEPDEEEEKQKLFSQNTRGTNTVKIPTFYSRRINRMQVEFKKPFFTEKTERKLDEIMSYSSDSSEYTNKRYSSDGSIVTLELVSQIKKNEFEKKPMKRVKRKRKPQRLVLSGSESDDLQLKLDTKDKSKLRRPERKRCDERNAMIFSTELTPETVRALPKCYPCPFGHKSPLKNDTSTR